MRAPMMSSWLLCAAVGCASAAPIEAAGPTSPTPLLTAGDQSRVEASRTVAPVVVPEPVRTHVSGPGSVTLVALVDAKPVPASVRVLDSANGSPKAETTSGAPISLPAGKY